MTNIRHGFMAVAIAVGATFGAVSAAALTSSDSLVADVVGGIFSGGSSSDGPQLGDVGGIFGGGGGTPEASGPLGDVGGIFGGGGG